MTPRLRIAVSGARSVATLVFVVAGLVIPIAWYGPVVVRGGPVSWILYFGLPAVTAGFVGAVGAPILRAPRCVSGGAAALRGAGLALVAFALFALLFGIGIKATEPGWSSALGLAVFTLSLGLVAAGWSVAALGALAGWVVWQLTRGLAGTGEHGAPASPTE